MIETKKYCYICSPYKGSALKRIRNIRYARDITERAINAGFIPITPHFIGERYGISAGMATEIELAKKSNKQIWRFDNDR